jgi:hypothetical protein
LNMGTEIGNVTAAFQMNIKTNSLKDTDRSHALAMEMPSSGHHISEFHVVPGGGSGSRHLPLAGLHKIPTSVGNSPCLSLGLALQLGLALFSRPLWLVPDLSNSHNLVS